MFKHAPVFHLGIITGQVLLTQLVESMVADPPADLSAALQLLLISLTLVVGFLLMRRMIDLICLLGLRVLALRRRRGAIVRSSDQS